MSVLKSSLKIVRKKRKPHERK